MKTLKKTLALVLVVVMALGLFAVSASAAELVDVDTIGDEFKEAAVVMNGMGIIKGDENGVFNPKGTLTRAEAATLITYITMGQALADSLSKDVNPMPDVPAGAWYAGYVNYCVSMGYINGDENGNFNPDDLVTGYEYAALLLYALGYGAADEYLGNGFPFNVARDALRNDIFDGYLSGLSDKPATREQAALYTYNALKQPTVTYSKIFETYAPTGNTLAADNGYGTLTDVEGVITNNSALDSAMVVSNVARTELDGGVTYRAETGAADLGSYVKIVTDGKAPATAKVYGVITLSESVTVSQAITTAAGYKAAFGTATAAAAPFTFTGNYGTVTAGLTGFTAGSAAPVAVYSVYNNKVYSEIAGLSETLEKIASVTTSGGVTTVKTTAGQLAAGVNANLITGDTVAKDDYVIVTKLGTDHYSVVKAKTVEGQATYLASNGALTVGGKAYAQSAFTNSAGLTAATINAAYLKSNTTKLYLDSKGAYIVAVEVEAESAASDAVFVLAAFTLTETDAYGVTSTNQYVQVVTTEGKLENVMIAKGGTIAAPGMGLYTYAAAPATAAVPVKGANVFTALSTTPAKTDFATTIATGTVLKANTVSVTAAVGKLYVNADTTYLFVDGTLGAAKVSAQTTPVTTLAATGYAVAAKDAQGNNVAKFVFVPSKFTEDAAISTDLIYVTSTTAAGTTANGPAYKVYLNGTAQELTISNVTATGFFTYSVNSNGVYSLVAAATVYTGSNNSGVVTGATFAGLYGTKLNAGAAIVDREAGSATIVDLRTAAQKTASGVDTIASLSDMLAAKNDGKTVTFDAVVASNAVTVIYITAVA